MPEETSINYQSFPNMPWGQEPGEKPVEWFIVHVPRNVGDAYLDIVNKLKGIGHTQVGQGEQYDYHLVFCPIASRVEADISSALNKITDGKPVILVVMHHTFNPQYLFVESKKKVNDPKVFAVDCLFHDGKFLQCKSNDEAWSEIQKVCRPAQVSMWQKLRSWCTDPYKLIAISVASVGILVLVVAILAGVLVPKQE